MDKNEMMNQELDSFLEHHGILGQKWGKRNGPPYPLEEGDHSAAEKKANPSLDKESLEERKKRVLASKDPEVLARNLDLGFTLAELNNFKAQLNLEKDIKKLAEEQRLAKQPGYIKAAKFVAKSVSKGLTEAAENKIKEIVKKGVEAVATPLSTSADKMVKATKDAYDDAKNEAKKTEENNKKK